MIRISQNQFLFLGVLIFIFFRVHMEIKASKKDEANGKVRKSYNFERMIYDLFIIYLIGVASKVYFPLVIGWGKNLVYNMPSIWLRPLWSLSEIYKKGGLYSLIYQVSGNLIILTPMTFFLCYFNQSSMLYMKGKKIVDFINIFWRKECSIDFSKQLNLKDITKISLSIAIFIETTQLILSLTIPNTKRFFEINDIIFNTISGIWGYYLFNIFVELRRGVLVRFIGHNNEKVKN